MNRINIILFSKISIMKFIDKDQNVTKTKGKHQRNMLPRICLIFTDKKRKLI